MAGTLHDGLRARELDVGTKSLGHGVVRMADQQETKLGLTELPEELGVAASCHVDRKGILRLLDHAIIKRIVTGVGFERGRHDRPEVVLTLRPPELFAKAAIGVA